MFGLTMNILICLLVASVPKAWPLASSSKSPDHFIKLTWKMNAFVGQMCNLHSSACKEHTCVYFCWGFEIRTNHVAAILVDWRFLSLGPWASLWDGEGLISFFGNGKAQKSSGSNRGKSVIRAQRHSGGPPTYLGIWSVLLAVVVLFTPLFDIHNKSIMGCSSIVARKSPSDQSQASEVASPGQVNSFLDHIPSTVSL